MTSRRNFLESMLRSQCAAWLLGVAVSTSAVVAQGSTFRSTPVLARFPAVNSASGLSATPILDVDGDESPDFLATGGYPSGAAPSNTLFTCAINDGSGRVRSYRYASFPSGPLALFDSWGFGDLDGDGHIDAVVAFLGYPSLLPWLTAYRGDGNGGFTEAASIQLPTPSGRSYYLAVRDLTGDGAGDIMIMMESGAPALLVNDGFGQFHEQPGSFPNGYAAGLDFAFADFDRDGDVDLLSADGFLFSNDGHGYFNISFTFQVAGGQALDIGDVDGDGYIDVLFAPYVPSMHLWINDRRGGFREEASRLQINWSTIPVYRSNVQLVDLDGDGDIDVFASTPPSGLEVFLNDGTGHFVEGRAALGLTNTIADYALDMDRDGDIDLFLASATSVSPRWYANLGSNFIANDPPVGGSLDIELHALTGRIVTYLLGFARQDTFIPGIGWSALDPTFAVPWPQSAIVSSSRVVFTSLAVPNNPTLRGLQVFGQGIDLDPQTARIHAMNFWPATIQ